MIHPDSIPVPATVAPDARVARRITWDSRDVGPETAFAALAGEKRHGNDFVQEAVERGAPFVLTDLDVPRAVRVEDATAALRAWGRAARDANPNLVVGITGSVGKTTAKTYVAAALGARYMPVYNTLNAIACFLLDERGSGVPLVVELGIDRIGEMDELMALVAPDVGVVTTIGEAHLEAFGTRETIAREKGRVLAARQPFVSVQARSWFPDVPTYGFEDAAIRGEGLKVTPDGASFEFRGHTVRLPLAGRAAAEAAVLGLELAAHVGLDLAEAVARLEAARVPGGRYRVYPGRFTVIDDAYNASPLSVKAALDALASFPGRRVSVLGRMLELGESEAVMHAEVGAHARERADVTFGVGRYAEALGEHAHATTTDLIPALLAEVRDGDVILVKASRGISWSVEERALQGVGLDPVVNALLERQQEEVRS